MAQGVRWKPAGTDPPDPEYFEEPNYMRPLIIAAREARHANVQAYERDHPGANHMLPDRFAVTAWTSD
jgi:hypothetical protein